MKIQLLQTGPLNVNTYLIPIFENKVIIIDPASCKFSRDEKKIEDFLTANNLSPIAIILTHGHFDHVSGLKYLHEKFPALPIAIHKNDAEMIGKQSGTFQGNDLANMGFDIFIPYVENLPDYTNLLEDEKNLSEIFSDIDDNNIQENLKKWKVIHTPGHTKGCICLYNSEDSVLISGDTLFYRSWGRTDLRGGDEREIQKSLQRIVEEVSSETRVYPGHDRTDFKLKDWM